MVVRRTINGATVRYLEYMLPEFDSAFITQEWARCWIAWRRIAVKQQPLYPVLSSRKGKTVAVVTDGRRTYRGR